ncbi:hypothetical protein [Bradyrhizobium sp. USDA 4353]
MAQQTADAYDAQMWTYREHLRGLNRRLAEDYARRNGPHVVAAIAALAEAAPVTLAIAQLHDAIRRSPAKNVWPILRKTRGQLLLQSGNSGQDCPWPWQRTKSGNLSYRLSGHLLFSPWPTNVRRSVRSLSIQLQQVIHNTLTIPDTSAVFFESFVGSILPKTRQAVRLIDEIKALQAIAMPDTIAALERWSGEPRPGCAVELRIERGALVYRNGSDRCELEIPATLTKPLLAPTTPDRPLERHSVQAGTWSYYP